MDTVVQNIRRIQMDLLKSHLEFLEHRKENTIRDRKLFGRVFLVGILGMLATCFVLFLLEAQNFSMIHLAISTAVMALLMEAVDLAAGFFLKKIQETIDRTREDLEKLESNYVKNLAEINHDCFHTVS